MNATKTTDASPLDDYDSVYDGMERTEQLIMTVRGMAQLSVNVEAEIETLRTEIGTVLLEVFGPNHPYCKENVGRVLQTGDYGFDDGRFTDHQHYLRSIAATETVLQSCHAYLMRRLEQLQTRDEALQAKSGSTSPAGPVDLLVSQLRRFGDGLSRIRRSNQQGKDGPRGPYRLVNEYDVQDALWVLVRPQFLDAVDESPSHKAGLTSSRADIWLPSLSTVIEVKFARASTDGKRLDAELKKDFVDHQGSGVKTVVVVIAQAQGVHGLEQLDNLQHTVQVPQVRIVRVSL